MPEKQLEFNFLNEIDGRVVAFGASSTSIYLISNALSKMPKTTRLSLNKIILGKFGFYLGRILKFLNIVDVE